ncbi:MAG TPA: trehalose-phosphatase [Rhodanobacteraceae bacterium]
MNSVPSAATEVDVLTPPARADLATIALFIDVDGTLLDFAERPDDVIVEPSLRAMLAALQTRLGGALAILSGRTLGQIDALLGLDRAAAAGLHGAELRGPGGVVLESAPSGASLEAVRSKCAALALQIPGLLVEDKGAAMALHYRTAPDQELAVRRAAIDLLDLAGAEFELLQGKFVIELKLRHADKGRALARLMHLAPFAERVPWMIGDDVTDEDAFTEANALDGTSILVGTRRPTAARHALASPAAARNWMATLLDSSAEAAR